MTDRQADERRRNTAKKRNCVGLFLRQKIGNQGIGVPMPELMRRFEQGHIFHVLARPYVLQNGKPVRYGLAIRFFDRRKVRRGAFGLGVDGHAGGFRLLPTARLWRRKALAKAERLRAGADSPQHIQSGDGFVHVGPVPHRHPP